MINFRENVLVDDDNVTMGSTTTASANEKGNFDMENMGYKYGKDDDVKKLPNILQNLDYSELGDSEKRKSLDYSGLDNNLKNKEGNKDVPRNPFLHGIMVNNKDFHN